MVPVQITTQDFLAKIRTCVSRAYSNQHSTLSLLGISSL